MKNPITEKDIYNWLNSVNQSEKYKEVLMTYCINPDYNPNYVGDRDNDPDWLLSNTLFEAVTAKIEEQSNGYISVKVEGCCIGKDWVILEPFQEIQDSWGTYFQGEPEFCRDRYYDYEVKDVLGINYIGISPWSEIDIDEIER